MNGQTPDYLGQNRTAWDAEAPSYVASAERAWAAEPSWGIWGVAEAELNLLPRVAGKRVLEAGCGTAYVSAWLARRGADAVGLDNSAAQLATAQRMQRKHDLSFPLIQGFAEGLPFRDQSFDLVVVRRRDLVRPVSMDPGSGPRSPTRWRAAVPRQLDAVDAVHPRRP